VANVDCSEMTARELICWGGLFSRMGEQWPHIFKGNQNALFSVRTCFINRDA